MLWVGVAIVTKLIVKTIRGSIDTIDSVPGTESIVSMVEDRF